MTQTAESMERVALARIRIQPGFNPRTYFDPAALASLTESVRKEGVVQPIVLRTRPEAEEGILWVVAGERRFRAATEAGLPDVPAVIRQLSDQQALAVAAIENTDRENMSVSEEALLARKALDACNGDKAEAGHMLNWPVSRLDARLLLLNAHPSVLEALTTRKLKVGHAELLSTLPEDVQEATLPSLIDKGVTVDDLKKRLASYTQELSAAPFSTEGCRGCPFNSSTNGSLFEFSVGEGRCSRKPCWDEKTEAFLAEKKATVATEVNVVFFEREKDPSSYTRLEMLGENGVGEEQYKSGCQSCRNFGALICNRPGKEGRVAKDVCFDTACNAEKRADYRKSLEPEPVEKKEEKAQTKSGGGKADSKAPARKKPRAAAPAPKKITALSRAFLRETAAPLAATDPGVRSLLELLGLMALCEGDVGSIKGLTMVSNHDLISTSGGNDVRKVLEAWAGWTPEQIEEKKQTLVRAFFAEKAQNTDEDDHHVGVHRLAAHAIAATKTTIEGRFKLTKEFLEAHTKSGIGALMEEAELWRSMPGDTDKAKKAAVDKLQALKHPEMVKAVLASGHNFDSFVPSSVRRAVALSK